MTILKSLEAIKKGIQSNELLDHITNLQKENRINNDLIPCFKNREKDTLDVQTDTIMPQKMDSVVPPVQPDTLKSISMSDTISKGEDKHEEIVAEPQMPEPSDSVSAQ